VRKMYELLARQYRVEWKTRNYDHTEWGSGDVPNRCLSSATACLYGICEAAILADGKSDLPVGIAFGRVGFCTGSYRQSKKYCRPVGWKYQNRLRRR
jgi:hypothetical protein